MKQCSKCHTSKYEGQFCKSPRYKDKLHPHCKECRAELKRVRLSANPTCSRCGSRPHIPSHDWCEPCKREAQGRGPAKFIRRSENLSVCPRCNVRPKREGYGYCKECSESYVKDWYKERGGQWKAMSADQRRKCVIRRYVKTRVDRGHFEKKFQCEICGQSPTEAHHYKGYSKKHALTVAWLCESKCHRLADAGKISVDRNSLGELLVT
jgi:hypothetical protein